MVAGIHPAYSKRRNGLTANVRVTRRSRERKKPVFLLSYVDLRVCSDTEQMFRIHASSSGKANEYSIANWSFAGFLKSLLHSYERHVAHSNSSYVHAIDLSILFPRKPDNVSSH